MRAVVRPRCCTSCCTEVTVVEITAVEMDGQAVLMQGRPGCRGGGAVDLVEKSARCGACSALCHRLRVVPYWLAGGWTA